MAFKRGPKIITDGLVLYLDAANHRSYPGSIDTEWDDLYKETTATLYNSPTYSDGSIVFDGIDDYGQLPSNSKFAIGGNGTWSIWCKFTGSITTNHRLFSVSNNVSSLEGYIDSSTGKFGAHGGNTITTSEFPLDSWINVTASYTSGTIKIYFNGISQSLTGTTTGFNITNSATLYIGKYTLASGFRWRGNISTFSLYNRGLTSDEVLQNYNTLKNRFK